MSATANSSRLLGKSMKLNALIETSLGTCRSGTTTMLLLHEHCYPRVPLVFLQQPQLNKGHTVNLLGALGSHTAETTSFFAGSQRSTRLAKQYSQD